MRRTVLPPPIGTARGSFADRGAVVACPEAPASRPGPAGAVVAPAGAVVAPGPTVLPVAPRAFVVAVARVAVVLVVTPG